MKKCSINNKVTKVSPPYPTGFEPNIIIPEKYTYFRYAIGKEGKNPLVAICMNPSAARETSSDMTINRIIKISQLTNKDGWIVFNIYPERATDAKMMNTFDESLLKNNLEIIKDFLVSHNVTEVLGAWGNDNNIENLIRGKVCLLSTLDEMGVKVFYFGTLTKDGNPRHPLQRQEKWDLSKTNYLD